MRGGRALHAALNLRDKYALRMLFQGALILLSDGICVNFKAGVSVFSKAGRRMRQLRSIAYVAAARWVGRGGRTPPSDPAASFQGLAHPVSPCSERIIQPDVSRLEYFALCSQHSSAGCSPDMTFDAGAREILTFKLVAEYLKRQSILATRSAYDGSNKCAVCMLGAYLPARRLQYYRISTNDQGSTDW